MEVISSVFMNILPFLIVLTIIVFVHEFGHFLVARLCGVKVDVFSIGFGKELFGFNDKHGTRWKFCMIPMGGYVKMFGDKNAASMSDEEFINSLSVEEKKVAFACKPLSAKAAIVVAGPAFNYLLSILIITFFFFVYGYPNVSSTISEVLPNSPASIAGIKPGDTISEINGVKIKNFNDIRDIMSLNLGESIRVKINDSEDAISITPEKSVSEDQIGNKVTSYRLGVINSQYNIENISIFRAIKLSTYECYKLSAMSLKAMWQMITGARSADELGGPIKIAQYSAKSAQDGMIGMLWFVALLSVNLGFVNLLPIPALDGGHLLIYFIELISNKKIAAKIQNYSFQIGLILLIMLTIFVTFSDLKSLILKFKS